jgi:hypothetical protein
VTPKDTLIKGLDWAAVSIGALLLGNMEGPSFPRAFEIRDKFLYWGEFYKEFEGYVKKGLINGLLSPYGSCWGTWNGSFTGILERKRGCISGFLFLGPRGR